MRVEEVNNKAIWEGFVLSRPEANFLQSWQWGVFQQKLGRQIIRLGIFEGEKLLTVCQAVFEPAKRGSYLAVAGGPLGDWQNNQLLELVWQELLVRTKLLGGVFIRVRPQVLDSQIERARMAQFGFQLSPMHLTADLTLELDLTQSEDLILAGMRKNTRSSIRKSDQLGLTTQASHDPAEIETMYQDQLLLAKKHDFVPFSFGFWQSQFQAFLEDNQVALIHSYSAEGKRLASAFIIFYNQQAFYHYGTSTEANGKLPGSYACQWRAIQEAKLRGCNRYNFWGVAPEGVTDHRFAGVSLFKRGFGGYEVAYIPAHDLPVSGKYQLTRSFEFVRKKLRRL